MTKCGGKIMPGYVIHIAVAKKYIRKHKKEINNERKFIEGAIAPDLIVILNENESKSNTHYGKWGNYNMEINLCKFLGDHKVDINNDYWKGYFLHLLTDYEFYLKYFKEETEELIKNKDKYYYDYDCLNKYLMEKFDIDKYEYERIANCISLKDDKPKYLKKEKIISFIENLSDIKLEEIIEKVKKGKYN